MKTVPAPNKVIVDNLAYSLNLVNGLIFYKSAYANCKCNWCEKAINKDDYIIFIPNSIIEGDPIEYIEEQCRLNAFNGSGYGVCLKCAPKKKQSLISKFKQLFRINHG